MKKVLALVLASAMALGMSAMAFAADSTAANPVAKSFENGKTLANGYGDAVLGISTKKTLETSANSQTVTYTEDVNPHDESEDYIYLTTDMFNWDGHSPSATNVKLSAKNIRASKLAVRTSVSSGSKAIDKVELENKESRINVIYVTEYVSTKDLDFDFTVYLTFDGKRDTDSGLTFVGTLANDITEVYEADDYVDLSDGQVAEAQDFVKDIEVDLGNGVSIFTKFFKGKSYYGTSTRDDDEADAVVFAKYPDIDNVVTLKTVGLNSTGDIVQLATDYSDYFVYDKDMNYLGQSNVLLPYSTKYYLANKKLDVVEGVDGETVDDTTDAPTTDDGDLNNVATGGDEGVANANANPSTGR